MKSIITITGITILFAIFACKPLGDLFSEYRNTNLLSDSAKSFSSSDWTPDQDTTYMNYEEVSGTGYEPPDGFGNATVYRLEIKNLIPNGDFEASTAGSAPNGWIAVNGGGGTDTLQVVNSGDGQISGKTMYFKTNNSADRMDFNIRDTTTGATDGFLTNASYLVRYDYRTDGQLYFEYNDTSISKYSWTFYGGPNGERPSSITNLIEFPPASIYEDFPDITVGSATTYNFTFGSLDTTKSGPQEGYIDNFRLVRTDITYKLRLTLATEDTLQPLISGWYRFSIYVKRDPSAGSNNRFQCDRITLGISGGGISESGGEITFDESTYSNYAVYYDGQDDENWSNWSLLSVDCFVQIPENIPETEATLQLSITPTDDTHGALNMDVGSILISSPSLVMSPDGF